MVRNPCKHGKADKGYNCKECKAEGIGGKGICEHQRVRSECKDCGGASICEHKRVRSQCIECGGSSFCEHQRRRSECKECRENLPIEECLSRYKNSCVVCGKKLQSLKRRLAKTCLADSQGYDKRPEEVWREHVLNQIDIEPSYIDSLITSCDKKDKFKPDLCYLTKDYAYVLELDEKSHCDYPVECELKKTANMRDLFPKRTVIMIRMNPHPSPYVPPELKEMAHRTEFMLELFRKIASGTTTFSFSPLMTNVFYLFYCDKGKKHIDEAKTCDSVNIIECIHCVPTN